jgi:hypothetical protein
MKISEMKDEKNSSFYHTIQNAEDKISIIFVLSLFKN